MPDEVNFIDLVALTRITPDTVAERFGGLINSSFFDASNILATLRQKGLIDFTTSFPGQSAVTVTDLGKKLLVDAVDGIQKVFGELDLTILTQLSNGKRTVQDLGGAINVRPTDLAMHLYKLGQQKYLMYDFRNGIVMITLTEKGFVQAKAGMPQPAAPIAQETAAGAEAQPQAAMPAGQMQAIPEGMAQPKANGKAAMPSATVDINQLEANIKKARRKRLFSVLALVAVAVVVVLALVFEGVLKY